MPVLRAKRAPLPYPKVALIRDVCKDLEIFSLNSLLIENSCLCLVLICVIVVVVYNYVDSANVNIFFTCL